MRLSKVYEPSAYENDIYALWEKSRVFEPNSASNTYSIVMPPPNANANLHIGYELTAVLEDIAARYQRGQGKSVLLLPGADHAGFETQSVYEKQLVKQGKSRFDFSREEMYQQISDFVAANRDNFETQIRKMGISCDWSKFTFTLDKKIVDQGYATFKKMWQEGLIYRGERLVNYCTFHRTGFADIEVAYEEATTPLYYLKYGPFTLATTRPETKFGDTAVAVHPSDKRYQDWVGKVIEVQGIEGPFEIRVIADEMVDPNFGTGAVKITPAHSFDDWEVAKRHNLPAVRVINHDGTLNEKAGRFRGLSVLDARKAVADSLQELGLLERIDENYQNRMGKCYKCGTIIEPMLMEQWFVDMKPLAKQAIKALRDNRVTFYPDSRKGQLVEYLEGLRDWNISRQIAWGIPIPAFQNVDDPDDWIYDERVSEEVITIGEKTYHRDPDVFDTWFSSSSWPYATLGYPKGDDFKQFYPLSVMETGADILYPWVSRMLMLGLYTTGEVPFSSVYLHGYIRAEDGSKMSKSLGNTVDPIPLIAKYGSDAVRMGLINGQAPAANRNFDERKILDARNFANKFWNVSRYIEGLLGDEVERVDATAKSNADHWILRELQRSQLKIALDLDNYRFSEAYETLYHFVWDDVADWYIEVSKVEPNKALLAYLLEQLLLIAHPFAPFLTETIWQTLAWENGSVLAARTLQPAKSHDASQAREFAEIQSIVIESRFICKALQVSGVTLYYTDVPFLEANGAIIKRLANLQAVAEVKEGRGLYLTSTKHRCWLDIDTAAAHAYAKSLETKLYNQLALIKQLEGRLQNTSYVKNAPKHVVEQTKQQLHEAHELQAKISEEVTRFSNN